MGADYFISIFRVLIVWNDSFSPKVNGFLHNVSWIAISSIVFPSVYGIIGRGKGGIRCAVLQGPLGLGILHGL